jgi:hypothetical protein
MNRVFIEYQRLKEQYEKQDVTEVVPLEEHRNYDKFYSSLVNADNYLRDVANS